MSRSIAATTYHATSSDELIFITGKEWQQLEVEVQEQYIQKAFTYWRQRGFPFRVFAPEEICLHFNQLRKTDSNRIFLPENELESNSTGLALANSFHPQMWSVEFYRHRTPVQCFNDDVLLKACLRQTLRLWPDRRGASDRCLRDILRTYRHTRRVSNFRPPVAKALYERYSNSGNRILDFSAGYGGRLLACTTLPRHYVGYDPCILQVDGLQNTYNSLKSLELAQGTCEIRKVCAEDEMKLEHDASFDLIFTSPPYYDRERYSFEPSQSFIRYPNYKDWRDKFLRVVISESHRLLKPRGNLILNVTDIEDAPIASDTVKFAKELFILNTEYHLRLSTLPFHRANGTIHYHYEPIFVFQKM
jgi:hypothetical protein